MFESSDNCDICDKEQLVCDITICTDCMLNILKNIQSLIQKNYDLYRDKKIDHSNMICNIKREIETILWKLL